MTTGSQDWLSTAETHKVFSKIPSAMAETLGSGSGSDLEVIIHPPAELLVGKSMKERRISMECLQFTEKDILLVPHIHKFRKLVYSPTYNITAEGYSKPLHGPDGYYREWSPDGQLHFSLHHSRQTGRMYQMRCAHYALPNDLREEIGKRVLVNEQFTPCFYHSNCHTTGQFQKVRWNKRKKKVTHIMP